MRLRILPGLLLALVVAAPVFADNHVVIFEDNNYGGQSRNVNYNGEGSVPVLADLSAGGSCHGAIWPATYPGWENCISSFIPNWDQNGCFQLWSGNNYSGTLIYSKVIRPGNVSSFPVADFNQQSMGTYNDSTSSIRIGNWTGSANSGHCVWAP